MVFFFALFFFAISLFIIFFFVRLFPNEDIGSYRAIRGFWVGVFWKYSAHAPMVCPIYAATFFPTNDPQATLATNRSNIQILGFDSRSAIGCGIVLSPQ